MTVATKERPILFSGPMVRAILEGRKTQTRRIVKPHPQVTTDNDASWRDAKSDLWRNCKQYARDCCPYGEPGDRLWVRETWAPMEPGPIEPGILIAYRADFHNDPHGYDGEKSPEGKYRTWKPSIFMPRWASRITLEITAKHIEPIQDISERDACAEGFGSAITRDCNWPKFAALWDKINGAGSWESNPFVWALTFKRIEG